MMEHKGGSLPPTATKAEGPPAHRPGLIELFLLFSQLGLSSFGGGVSAWMHRTFVEQRGWLAHTEFAAAMALSRIMPGANVVNLAVIIGQRLRGAAGACAAAAGLLVFPGLAIVAVTAAYRQFAATPVVSAALEGTAAAAVGLLIAMGIRMGRHLVGASEGASMRAVRRIAGAAIIAAVFLLVGMLRLHMVATVLCLAPLSIAVVFLTRTSTDPGHVGG
jgi:chromate transporter